MVREIQRSLGGGVPTDRIELLVEEMRELIALLEKKTGRRFSEDEAQRA